MSIEIRPISIDEIKLTGERVLSTEREPYVTLRSETAEDGTVSYSSQAHVLLGRDAISSTLANAMGVWSYRQPDWRRINNGLKDMSYPSKRITQFARRAGLSDTLMDVRLAAGELANTMQHNQPYRSVSVNIPALTYGETTAYVADTLASMDKRRLALMMKSVGLRLDDEYLIEMAINQPAKLEKVDSAEPSEDIAVLEAVASLLESRDFYNNIDDRTAVELIERFKEDNFSVFPRAASFDGKKFVGGTDEPEIYILDEDVPAGLERARSDKIEDLLRQKKVIVTVGPRLPDDDRKRGLERHRVTFRTHAPLEGAFAKVAWNWANISTGQDQSVWGRNFIFPESTYDITRDDVVTRPNTALGAAVIAAKLGQDIDYRDRHYEAYVKQRQSGAYFGVQRNGKFQHDIAAMWPLYARHQQERLPQDYFAAVEDRLQ